MLFLKIDLIKENLISVLENLENDKTSVIDGGKDLNMITTWIGSMIKERFFCFKERLTKIDLDVADFYLQSALDELSDLITKINLISADFSMTLSKRKAKLLEEKVNEQLCVDLLKIKHNLLILKQQDHEKSESVSISKNKRKVLVVS